MREKQIIESIKENKDIIYDKNFFDYIKGTSLLELRKNINLVQDLNPTLYLEEKVVWYYD